MAASASSSVSGSGGSVVALVGIGPEHLCRRSVRNCSSVGSAAKVHHPLQASSRKARTDQALIEAARIPSPILRHSCTRTS